MYRLIRGLLRLMLSVFFRHVEVVGRHLIPDDGGVIFAGNHPNSLIDPALIIATCGRRVQFAAKDVLFESRLLRIVLTWLGAVPIRRPRDHDGKVDNSDAFGALTDVLGSGGAMGIFPEGISHNDAQLSRLKTGAARIALAAARSHPESPVRIVPCGLIYVHRRRFRSRALVQFGEPIEVRPDTADGDDRAAARELTAQVDARLRALTINADDWDTLRVLDGVRRLYQPKRIELEQRVELARRFSTVYREVRNEADVRALWVRVSDYLDRLRAAGLHDRDLTAATSRWALGARIVAQVVLMAIYLPLALPGVVLFAPLGFTVGWAGVILASRKDVIATTKLISGFLAVFLLHVSFTVAIGWWFGWWWSVFAIIVLNLSGFACIRVLERIGSLGRLTRRVLKALLVGERIDDLRAERAALEREVAAAVDRHIPADMERLFPAKGG